MERCHFKGSTKGIPHATQLSRALINDARPPVTKERAIRNHQGPRDIFTILAAFLVSHGVHLQSTNQQGINGMADTSLNFTTEWQVYNLYIMFNYQYHIANEM